MTGGPDGLRQSPPAAGRARPNLILIGYRGSGKSAVGRLVARHLGWEFWDTDELIASAAQRSIAAIFAADGEAGFRALESRAIAQATAGTRRVISVGGGGVLRAENRRRLRAAGLCVWLTAPPEELHRRLRADPRSVEQRPALTAADGLEEVRRVLAFRQPLYQSVADRLVDTLGRSPDEVARDLIALVTSRSTPREES